VNGLCLRIANVIKDMVPDVLCVLEVQRQEMLWLWLWLLLLFFFLLSRVFFFDNIGPFEYWQNGFVRDDLFRYALNSMFYCCHCNLIHSILFSFVPFSDS
jgi:hypothetical protein